MNWNFLLAERAIVETAPTRSDPSAGIAAGIPVFGSVPEVFTAPLSDEAAAASFVPAETAVPPEVVVAVVPSVPVEADAALFPVEAAALEPLLVPV